jgi:putative transposase
MAYKCRAYPTAEQAAVLHRTFGCARLVWNRLLAWRRHRWYRQQQSTNVSQANAFLTALKADPELAFLREVSSVPLQQVTRIQQQAFAHFFAGRSRYPRFKSRTGRQAAEFTRGFRWRNGRLWLAKLDVPLDLVWSWPDTAPASLDPSTVTVSRGPDGRWYVSLAVDVPDPSFPSPTGTAIGIDLGIGDFAVTSDGERIANPRLLARKARNLARYQRRMARCQPGSHNRTRAKAKVARAHRKVAAARADFLHRTSIGLVRRYDTIVVEDLHVVGMLRNRKLAKAISDCGWGTFRRMLEYKAARAGRRLVVIDRWYPSSKTCSACGYLLDSLKLSIRTWTCPDRDVNAAQNILAAGRAVTACGGDVRHSEHARMRSPVKQETPPVRVGISRR